MTFSHLTRLFAALTLAAACSGDDGTSGADSSSGGSTGTSDTATTSSTSATTSMATTSAGSESDSATTGTSAGTSTGGTTTTTGGTTDATTGGTTGGVDPTHCADACANITVCVPMYPMDVCMMECSDDYALDPSPECQMAKSAANECLAGLACSNINMGDPGECAPLFDAVDASCQGDVPLCTPSMMMMGKTCTVAFDCEGVVSSLQCNGKTCTCDEDGMVTGECPDMGVCMLDLDAATAAANECCGWNF